MPSRPATPATAAPDTAAAMSAARAALPATAGAVAGGPVAPSSRPVPALDSVPPPRPVRHPWAPGDDLHRPTVTGAPPGPATVRKRAWSAYATIAPVAVYGAGNLERLAHGRAPMRYNPLLGGVELMGVDVDGTGHAHIAWPDSATALDPFAAAS